MISYLFLITFSALVLSSESQEIKYKICTSRGNEDECQQLARTLKLACRENIHNVDCLIDINNNKAHIGRIYPEEAFLGANLLSDRVQVLGEVETDYAPSETVVIIRNNVPNSIINLKGKKLCHPGFKHDSFSPLLLQELEQQIIALNNNFCSNENMTLTERHIKTLSEFFDESCRPGPWTQDSNFDQTLKNKYSNLCSLCGPGKCDANYEAPFNDSLKCLTFNNADVAISTLYEAELFFQTDSSNSQNFKYLCKNGTSSSSTVPCTWTKQLRSLIVIEKNAASDIKEFIKTNLKTKLSQSSAKSVSQEVVEQALIKILNLKNFEYVKLIDNFNIKSLKNYVSERRDIPTNSSSQKCKRSIKWCTYSAEELTKCQWLSQAALNRGIQPIVECYRSSRDDELSCVSEIENQLADIVVVSADYGYVSLKKKLTSLAYPSTDTRYLYNILAVKRRDDNSIQSFSDLKGKRVCIPQYQGKEFLAIVDIALNHKLIEKSGDTCNYDTLFNDLVGDSCAPGVLSPDYEVPSGVDTEKLCRQCVPVNRTSTAVYCNADNGNKYWGTRGATKCLEDGNADYAVIVPYSFRHSNVSNLQVICKNGSLANSDISNPLNVDSECALNIITTSEVVSRLNNANNPDIKLALREFERWFGQDLNKPFHVFDQFNHTKDLLFKDSTLGLDFDDKNEYIQHLEDLLTKAETCENKEDPNAAATNMLSITLIFVVVANIIFKY